MKYIYPILLIALIVTAGCKKESDKTILARFDGQSITVADFQAKLSGLSNELRAVALQRKADLLDDMSTEHFLLKEAKKRGIAKEAEVQDLIEAAKKKIIIAKLVQQEVDSTISLSEEEARSFYEGNKESFVTPMVLRASHILFKTEEEAKKAKSELKRGANFEEMAAARSTDKTSAYGGDIGYFKKGQLIPELEEVAFGLEKGQVSDVFQTQFGYHILKLTERVEPAQRSFQAVKRSIAERLSNAKRSKAFLQFIGRLKEGSQMKIEEEALENFSWDGVGKVKQAPTLNQ